MLGKSGLEQGEREEVMGRRVEKDRGGGGGGTEGERRKGRR